MAKIIWTEQDWENLALKLAEWRPSRLTAANLNLAPGEVERAMNVAISPTRHRSKRMCKACQVTPFLKSAYKRLRERKIMDQQMQASRTPQKPTAFGTVNAVGYIIWSEDEWQAIAVELERIHPGIFKDRLKDLRIPYIREAQKVLPPHRHKFPAALELPRKGLLKAWDRIARFEPSPPQPQEVQKQAEVAPVEQPKEESAGRIFWNAEEWITLALEVHRINPHQKFIESKTLAGLKPQDIKPAIEVLPPNRRRECLTVTPFRKGLLDAFATIRARQAEERLAEIESAPQPVQQVIEQITEQAPEVNPFEAAMAPMIKLFAEEFGKAFLPMVSQMLRDLVAPVKQTEIAQQTYEQVPEKTPPVIKALLDAITPKAPKLPRIAVVGLKSDLQGRLKKKFPNVNFTFVDASNNANKRLHDAVRNCDQVIAATSFVGHSTEGVLRKEAGDRFRRVHGGLSAIRHQIGVFLATDAPKDVGGTTLQ